MKLGLLEYSHTNLPLLASKQWICNFLHFVASEGLHIDYNDYYMEYTIYGFLSLHHLRLAVLISTTRLPLHSKNIFSKSNFLRGFSLLFNMEEL